jgi:hypothetical protein
MNCFILNHIDNAMLSFATKRNKITCYNIGLYGYAKKRGYSCIRNNDSRASSLISLSLRRENHWPGIIMVHGNGNTTYKTTPNSITNVVYARRKADVTSHEKQLIDIPRNDLDDLLKDFVKRLDDFGKRLDDLESRLLSHERIHLFFLVALVGLYGLILNLSNEINNQLDKMNDKLDESFDRLDEKLDKMNDKLDEKIDRIYDKFDNLFKEIHVLSSQMEKRISHPEKNRSFFGLW